MITDPSRLNTVLVTDCGSTTTKALLFERTAQGWRQTSRGEAPTTVEEPVADVTVGATHAFSEIQEVRGRRILNGENGSPFLLTTDNPDEGIDLYLSTSSAGGGLQMMVTGLVRSMTTESAERAALGAGAIVMDAISADDGREDHERIQRIRHVRPDIVLLTGGVDRGSRTHAIEMAEILLAASPRPRFGETLELPVIYAGNHEAAEEVTRILERIADVTVVDNVRPEIDREHLGPAREAIHELFLSHVMSHSPGYGKLLSWTPVPIIPTPAAVGNMVQTYAAKFDRQVLCVDIGGATTDVFSVFKGPTGVPAFNRTVSANLGMSYSIANVLVEAGTDAIARWLPYDLPEWDLRDRLRNKMIRPTTIPQTLEDLWLEQAVCREALRLSLAHHRSLAIGLSGVTQERGIADIFSQKGSRYELVDLMKLDCVIGSGGVLSHAPGRVSAALMMMEGFELCGVTQLTVDSIFMMPHLGVFAEVHPEAAAEIFLKDCIVNLGYSIVPVHRVKGALGDLAKVTFQGTEVGTVKRGEVERIMLPPHEVGTLSVVPQHPKVDVGRGPGAPWEGEISVGEVGLLLDGRNRPIEFPASHTDRVRMQARIFERVGMSKGS
jgi:uncharacterized protein (TIGR01319 family)